MPVCEYRWLCQQFYAVPPNQRHLWLRENAGHVALMGDVA